MSGLEIAASLIGGSSAAAGIANTFVDINQARINRQFQLDMSSTAYQRAVADMRAAGINPMLAASNGGASTAAGSTAHGALDASGVASALQYKLQREEQDNRNKVADATARKIGAEATKEETTVPAYEWGQKLLLELRPYADKVLDWAANKVKDLSTGKLGDDLAKWAADHNLGTNINIPDPLKAQTWNKVGEAIATAAKGAVVQGTHSAKKAVTDRWNAAMHQLHNSYLLKRHDTSPLKASDPAFRRLPGIPKHDD